MAKTPRPTDPPDPRSTRLVYDVVEKFFTAAKLFGVQYSNYESRVLNYSESRGTDRTQLRLSALELSTLFDFKALEQLRDSQLFPLKDFAHRLFRRDDHTDAFDRYVSDLFHELSILKEEHYTVQMYAPQFEAADEGADVEALLDEVHEFFPRRLRTIRRLFQKSQSRLLAVLPDYAQNGILLRSLAIYGEDIVGTVLPGGLSELLSAIFPREGAAWAFCEAAQRFLNGGFETWAGRCCDRAEKELAAQGDSAEGADRVRTRVAELREAAERRTADAARAAGA